MRLPYVNLKRPLWRGGPQLDEVVKSQLAPAAAAPAAVPAGSAVDDAELVPDGARDEVQLLLLLR